ncbi:MAG TPA: DUF935 domain-containing protein [Candidatus Binataceae bacterium]|nr:DUF935 domain-containing protein [Candidatus Binataceae bacterium]
MADPILYDYLGRKVDLSRLKQQQAAPTLAGLRNIYSTVHVAAGLTPERLSSVMRIAEYGDPFYYLELCEDIEERDLHYSGILNTRKRAVAQLEPIIKPAGKDAESQKIADFVKEVLLDSEMQMDLVAILDSLGKGFSASEIIWDQSGKQWVPRSVEWRDPRWFMFDWISGTELLVRTLDNVGPEIPGVPGTLSKTAYKPVMGGSPDARIGYQPMTAPLAPFKFIQHVSRAKAGFPIRGGLTRIASWAYLFKIYCLKDWITFCEIFGQPLRTGKYGAGASEQDKETLLRAVAAIGTDAAAIIPESMNIEFVDSGGQARASAELYEKLCMYLDAAMSKLVLGQTLTTELPKGGGSRAAAQVHESVKGDILAYDARELSLSISRQLVKPLVDLNIGPQKKYPQFWLGLPDDQDVKVFVDVVGAMVDRGLKVGQRTVLDKLGLPEPEVGDDLLVPIKSGGSSSGDSGDGGADSALSAAQKKKSRWNRY